MKCNICGKEFDEWDTMQGFGIQTYIGFGSRHDMSMLNLHICCDCMDTIIDSCVISPIEENNK